MRRPMSLAPFAVWLAVSALALVSLPAVAHAVVVQITNSIAANTSWGLVGSGSTVEADVFWVRNSINVNSGFTLTIRQGVVVKLDPGVAITAQGALQCQGTSGSNVVITSIKDDTAGGDTNGDSGGSAPAASDWQSLYFTALAPDSSRLTYTQVRYAGYGNHGGVTFNSVSGRLTNCTFQRCYWGIDLAGTAAPLIVDCNALQSTLTPVVLDASANPAFTRFAFSVGDNGYDAWGVRGNSISGTSTLPKRAATVGATLYNNVTYVLLGSLTVNAASTLNLAAGITLKMASGVYINVFGTLNMTGTVTDTIYVTSIHDDNFGLPGDTAHNGSSTSPQRGDWNGLYWNPGASGTMSYCRMRFGTNSASYGMIDLTNVNLPVANSILSDAAHGLAAHGTSAPTVNAVTIANCSSTPTLQSVTAAPSYSSITFQNNSLTALGLIGEAFNTSVHLTQQTVGGYANITYLVVGAGLTVNTPATLLIDPGVVIKFTAGSGINVYSVLDAQGTGPAPITFTSWKDDAYGNPADTNGDFAATTPVVGDWYYIYFDDTAVDATCKLTNNRILYAGNYPYYASVYCLRSSQTITGNTISHCAYGARFDGPSSPNFSNNAVSFCNYAPILMSAMADPTLTGNTFTNCAINGIGLLGETLTQSATLKYRPTVTFPPPNQTTVFAYVPTGTITVPAGMVLTIQPQVVIKPTIAGGNWFDIFGTLNAVGGTGANRIVFTSFRDDSYAGDTNGDFGATGPAAGNWGTLYFEDSSVDAACVIRNAVFQYGSSDANYGAISTLNASPKLAAIDFFANGTGLTTAGISAPNCDSLNFLNSTGLPAILSLASNPTFAHTTFANNAWTALGLIGENVTQNVTLSPRVFGSGILNPIVYIPTGNITIGTGTTWTISPGTIVKFGRVYSESFGTQIVVNGALNATGTSGSPIFLTSTADDAIGGDTHGDGSLTAPAIDNWTGIGFGSGSNGAGSAIAYCRFRYGGYIGSGLSMNGVNVPVSNSTFYTCSTGLTFFGNAAPTITSVQLDTCTVPIRLSLVSNPAFSNVNFVNCTYTALGVVNETLAQDVLWKIRPVSGRLNMPYLVDGGLAGGPGVTLTMQPGVIVKLAGGSIDINKALTAIGRTIPESLVVFTSYRDDSYGGKTWINPSATSPGFSDWNYIIIENTAIDASCVFRDCVVRYGGSGSTYGAIRCVNSSPTIDSTIVAYNSCGVSAEGASNPLIRGGSLYGNQNFAVNNTGGAFCVTATGNYWGAGNGPSDPSAAADLCGTNTNAGSGDIVSQNVNYSGFAAIGVNPMLGDVSLNGQVRAYDASLVLQSLISLVLTPLQKLVANVDNNGAIDNTDASFILQFVAGVIPALPGNATRLRPLSPAEQAQVAAVMRHMQGSFTLHAGAPRRVGGEWELPILADGDASIFGAEVTLSGSTAAAMTGVSVAEGAMEAHGTIDGTAKLAMASATPIAPGEIALFRFPASGDDWQAPTITFARVNSSLVTPGPGSGPAPAMTFFATPWPNPATVSATLRLGISSSAAGASARVGVYDLAGRRVRTLQDGPLTAGVHELVWDLRDGAGHPVSPGMYMLRAETAAFRSVQRLVVVR